MAKDPAVLFYPNDYLGETIGMSFEEKGAYMELLILQFNVGHMTEHMIHICIGKIWTHVKHRFDTDQGGKYYNVRFEEEQEKRKKYSESRRNNRLKAEPLPNYQEQKTGSNSKNDIQHMNSHMNNHMTVHMENENGNKNKVQNKKGIPTEIEFVQYGLEKAQELGYNVPERELKAKRAAWVANGWKNGNDKRIKNWPSNITNSLRFMDQEPKAQDQKEKPDLGAMQYGTNGLGDE